MRAALSLAVGLLANAAIFYGVARTNASAKPKPVRETWALHEVFTAAPPPRPTAPREDAPREVVPEASFRAPKPEAPSTEPPALPSFAPRLGFGGPDFSSSIAVGGPLVPAFAHADGGVGPDAWGSRTGVPGGGGPGGPLRLSQVDRGPQRVLTPLPPYPSWARTRRLQGTVTVLFTVDEQGAVRDAVVESVDGDERFGPIALETVSGWRYEPGVYDGHKVPVRITQRIRFNLVDR
jgi:TonB family protein